MTALKQGSSGSSDSSVRKLQKNLRDLGFNPGRVDGVFGPATKTAVIAFQKSKGIVANGNVGPKTLSALNQRTTINTVSVIPLVTVDIVSKMFPFTPPSNIKANLPYVLSALENDELTDKNMLLMALSTIRAEAESFEPISEFISRFNTSPGGRPFDLYDYRRDLGNLGPPDGERYRGRGFIQLTGRINYKRYGKELGLDNQLIDNPKLANEVEIAAKLLAAFLKDKEARINEVLLNADFRTARRLVNGGNHGLERFTEAYRIGERLIV